MLIAKLPDNTLVQIVKAQKEVAFSTEKNWLLLCFDFEVQDRLRSQFKWVKAESVTFTWVRMYGN